MPGVRFGPVSAESDDPVETPPEVVRDIASCARSHRSLADHLGSVDGVDPGSPSLLPGWTLGHVLTHIARNGDSHLDMLAGRPQYPSVAARNAAIDEGAGRPWSELVADVERAGRAVDAAFDAVEDWDAAASTVTAERPRSMLPLLRQREVEIHRIDLDLGYGFADLPSDYVRRELRLLEMLWTARQPMGLTRLPAAVLERTPHERLSWMLGRSSIEGVVAAGVV